MKLSVFVISTEPNVFVYLKIGTINCLIKNLSSSTKPLIGSDVFAISSLFIKLLRN